MLRPATIALLLGFAAPAMAQDAAEPDDSAIAVVISEAAPAEPAAEETAPPDEALVVLDGASADLEALRWTARPIIVFADTPADPRFDEQMGLIAERPAELAERDVVVITDTDPAAMSDVRRKLRPRGFMLALIAKDGTVNLRKPFPWDVREISRAIDKMPMRQEELRRQ